MVVHPPPTLPLLLSFPRGSDIHAGVRTSLRFERHRKLRQPNQPPAPWAFSVRDYSVPSFVSFVVLTAASAASSFSASAMSGTTVQKTVSHSRRCCCRFLAPSLHPHAPPQRTSIRQAGICSANTATTTRNDETTATRKKQQRHPPIVH